MWKENVLLILTTVFVLSSAPDYSMLSEGGRNNPSLEDDYVSVYNQPNWSKNKSKYGYKPYMELDGFTSLNEQNSPAVPFALTLRGIDPDNPDPEKPQRPGSVGDGLLVLSILSLLFCFFQKKKTQNP